MADDNGLNNLLPTLLVALWTLVAVILYVQRPLATLLARWSLMSKSAAAKADEHVKTVSGIFIYPVKSLRAVEQTTATLDAQGLAGDRRLMLIAPKMLPQWKSCWNDDEASHRFISQRQIPRLATVTAQLVEENDKTTAIRLTSHLLPGTTVTVPLLFTQTTTKEYLATLWDDVVRCQDLGDEAARFFQQLLQVNRNDTAALPDEYKTLDLRLVQQAPEDPRVTNDAFTPAAARSLSVRQLLPTSNNTNLDNPRVALTDGFPLLIATEASLAELNRRMAIKQQKDDNNNTTITSIPMKNFRPNIVVAGGQPFEEDRWKVLDIDGVLFHVVKACPRCKQSCTDQTKGQVHEEPLATLREFRALHPANPEDVFFAQNVVAGVGMAGRTISKGAVVKVLEWGEPVWG